ncbi:MAG: tetratricopeptide repeat protein [Bacteroidales bacterium]|nr:tetratricopeptide repeat protein [Bacteroidales bacterium]
MGRNLLHTLLSVLLMLIVCQGGYAQADRHDVRQGNRRFRKGDHVQADISYRKALAKDSTSFAAGYNLANNLFRQENVEEAATRLESLSEAAKVSPYGAQYYYNKGDVAIAKQDWQGAVDALKESLLRNPSDMDAKENYIYAKKKLEEQQQNGGGGDNDQQQDQNQDQNGGGDNNQNQQDQQNQDQQNNGNQNQDQKDNQSQQGQQPQDVKISPQQAQQMLQAIQAKEKETQDKVNKEKAEVLKSRQKEKNW